MVLNVQAARGGVAAVDAIAILSTCFRLGHRLRARKLWWDDFWAFIALFTIIPLLITAMISPLPPRNKHTIYVLYRMSALMLYTCCLWMSRISVAVTLVRLLPPGNFRKLSKAVAVFFGAMCIALLLQKVFMCGKVTSATFGMCAIPTWTAPLELTGDIVGDVWLIVAPAYMLFQLELPRNQHRLILAIFACGILNTIASIFHCLFIIKHNSPAVGTSGNVQAGISLIVCNLLVVVTYFYRVFNTEEVSDEENSDTKSVVSGTSGKHEGTAGDDASALPVATLTSGSMQGKSAFSNSFGGDTTMVQSSGRLA